MFCGSCMHDNTLARALAATGETVSLIPTYTPIRVDEENLSEPTVYLGGINVYLESRSRLWRAVPRFLKHWLDAPGVIRLATKFGVSNNAKQLGELTLDMLAGADGSLQRAVEELVRHLIDLQPDVILFSNALLCGVLRPLRERFTGSIFCLLQGDDVFLEDLSEPYRSRAIAMVSERAALFDGYLVHSRYYRDFMSGYLQLRAEKFHRVPLGIDLGGHDGQPVLRSHEQFTVGYFARICPEKGLHNLVEAFQKVHAEVPSSRLRVGGSLSKRDHSYFRSVEKAAQSLGEAFAYVGSPQTRREKVDFLKSLDVLSVPTTYREPKGLYVLEALANGVPVIEPRHGAFSELLQATGGGLLVEPGNAGELAAALLRLYRDEDERLRLARTGHEAVHRHFGPEEMARRTLAVLKGEQRQDEDFLPRPSQVGCCGSESC